MLHESLSSIQPGVWLAICVTLVVYMMKYTRRDIMKKFPPGPVGLPVVGYIPFLSRDAHLKFTELAEKYGEVFSLRLGSKTVVVLNGTDSIKEAFAKKEFLGRPESRIFSLLASKSPFFQNRIQLWKEQRRFVMHSLKDFGLGKSKLEENVQDEISHFQELLQSQNGEPMDVRESLTFSISNNICYLLLGSRYEYGDPEKILLDDSREEATKVIVQTAVHFFFPWMRHFMFILKWLSYEKGVIASHRFYDLVTSKVQEHKKTLDPNNIRGFIDKYLVEIENRRAKDPNATFTEVTLVGCAGDLFGAGSESMQTSISWCIYVVAAYSDVQRRIQKEIVEVSATDRMPEFRDLKAMPYTHAVILEIMRWKTIVPLNILRYTLDDTSVGGYDIPRGTIVIGNIWAVHHDPKHWTDPDVFKPERFLAPDGKSVVKSTNYMPFSVGKRICPGESIAILEIFLYLTSILKRFDVQFPEGVKPTFAAEFGITYKLMPYEVCFLPRS